MNEEQHKYWLDPNNWKLFDSIYCCKQDPRMVVPKKFKDGKMRRLMGTTWNFAHPKTYLLMLAFITFSLLPTALAWLLKAAPTTIFFSFVIALVIAHKIAWHMAVR